MYDQVVKCQRAGLCLSEHFLIQFAARHSRSYLLKFRAGWRCSSMHRFHARSAYVALSRKRTGVQLKAYQVAVVDSVGFSAVAARVSDIVT